MITSTSNSQIKNMISLLKKSGERKDRGLFVIEGIRMFREIPKERLVSIYVSESFAYNNKEMLMNYQYEMVSDALFKQMSETKTPQGIMASVKMLNYEVKDMLSADKPALIVVLENIQDPGNLGTILRSAEGAGATGVLMSKDTVDIYNPKTIRSTMGSLFRVPFVYADNIINTVNALKNKNVITLAAHLNGDHCYYEEDMCKSVAVMIGNEGNGLTRELTACAEHLVKIPMQGHLESLNAAVSTSIILYEAARQRVKFDI